MLLIIMIRAEGAFLFSGSGLFISVYQHLFVICKSLVTFRDRCILGCCCQHRNFTAPSKVLAFSTDP